ncbi:MAG: RNA methyltransferase [Ruminococcus sp.]|nr:RNA methyltransferase [Ruminococcus sp.]
MADLIRITDTQMTELSIFRSSLSEPAFLHYYEPEPGVFFAESPRVILRALDAGYRPLMMISQEEELGGETGEAIRRCGEIPVYVGSDDITAQVLGFRLIRGAICVMRRRALPPAAELCRGAERVAVLENVVNPANVGAIFRSAAALDMDAVLLTPSCSDPLYRRSTRVSMGTVFQVPWTYLPSDTGYVPLLRELGLRSAALALCEDTVSIEEPFLRETDRLAVILGTEGEGLSEGTIRDSDYTVKIPMSHGVDSLNVAAASAVAFWQLRKKRK